MRTLSIPLILAACVALFAVACGGGTTEAPPAAPVEKAGAPQPSGAPPTEPPPLMSTRGPEPSQLPEGHPPIAGAPGTPDQPGGTILPPPPGSGVGESGLAWSTPQGWVEERPSSTMRRAQYRVPGPAGDGECVVYYFGPGQGGGPEANIERWAGQFVLADGSPAFPAAKTDSYTVGDVQVHTVEVAGTYDGGMTMTAAPPTPMPGYMLLGAIAEGPDANWFFKFTGPEATVKANRAAFDTMVRSLKKAA